MWNVQGTALDVSGNPVVSAGVTAVLSVKQAVSPSGQVVPTVATATTDGSGHYTFSLWSNTDLTPSGTSYIVEIAGAELSSFSIVVPNTGYQGGRSYYDIALDELVVAIPPAPGQYVARTQVSVNNGALLPNEPTLNVIPVSPVQISAADDPTHTRTDVTVSVLTGTGGLALESDVTTEAAARTAGDATNATAITTETTRAEAAEAANASAISTKVARSVADWGVVPTNPDNTAAWANAEAAAAAGGFDLWVPGGVNAVTVYNFTSGGVTWDPYTHSVFAVGLAQLNFTAAPAGYCMQPQGLGTRSSSYLDRASLHDFRGLEVLGPDTDATAVDWCLLTDAQSGGSTRGTTFRNLKVFGFRDHWVVGNNGHLIRWDNVVSLHGHRYGLSGVGTVNAGENLLWTGGKISGFSNPTNGYNAAAVYTAPNANDFDIYLDGPSVDYNDIEYLLNSGQVTHRGHLEDSGNNGNSMAYLTSTANTPTRLVIEGSISPTEAGPGRTNPLFQAVSGSNINITFVAPVLNTYGKQVDLAVVQPAAAGATVHWFGAQMAQAAAPNISRPGQWANMLSNGNFYLGNTNGWRTQGLGGGALSVVAGQVQPYAAQFVGVGSTGCYLLYQQVACPSLATIFCTAQMACSAYVSGTVYIRLQFLNSDGSLISVTTTPALSAAQALTRMGGGVVTPQGTASVTIGIYQAAFSGTMTIEDVQAWVTVPYSGGLVPVAGTAANTFAAGNDSRITGAAPLASPALTGTPTAPTAAALTDNTQIATTAYADSAVAVEKARAMAAEAGIVGPSLRDVYMKLTSAIAESVPRWSVNNATLALTSGTLCLTPIALPTGTKITSITFLSGGTAFVAGTSPNKWFALLANNLNVLAQTADDTNGAWAASSGKTLNLSPGTFTTTYTGLYYLACLVVAGSGGTMPTLQSFSGSSSAVALGPPTLGGTSSSGLTNPASCPSPVAAIAGQGSIAYAYVS